MMEKAFEKMYPCDCPVCNRKGCLDLYDLNNYPIHLTMITDFNNLKNRQLSYFRCRICKTEFGIDWEYDRNTPYPLPISIMGEKLESKLSKSIGLQDLKR